MFSTSFSLRMSSKRSMPAGASKPCRTMSLNWACRPASSRRSHDVAAGMDHFEHLAGVRGVHPEAAAAAALKYQIAGRGHDSAVVAANARRSFVLPDDFLGHRVPGAEKFAHQLRLSRGVEV